MGNGRNGKGSGEQETQSLWLPPPGYKYDPTASIKTGLAVVVSVAVLLSMLMSVVAWGLKLEGEKDSDAIRISHLEREIAALKTAHSAGMHVVTASEVRALKDRLRNLEVHNENERGSGND